MSNYTGNDIISTQCADKPNYVLRTNEAVLIPESESILQRVVKIGVWIVVMIIVIGSLLFGENLFSEISWNTRVLLIVLAVGIFI